MTDTIAWPPPYTVRRYRLARHVRLRASRTDGLVISTPQRFSLKHIPKILEEHREWIIVTLQEMQVNKSAEIPAIIELPALGQRVNNNVGSKEKLIRWLRKVAKDFLSRELKKMSEECGLPFSAVTVRDQKTLWGSCTAEAAISLNYKLIFLPYPLARHVMLHELCHTQHHNHSIKFWQLVAKHDENWREHKRQLRQADKLMPGWI